MWKWILRIGIVVFVLLVIVILFFLGPVATSVGSSTMGVQVSMDSLSASPLKGSVGLDNLLVANPEGYESEFFINLKKLLAAARVTSFLGDTVKIRNVNVDELTIYIESKGGKTNLSKILDNLDKGGAESTGEKDEEASSEGTNFVIEELRLTNIKVILMPEIIKKVSLTIGELVLNNIGTEDKGASLSEVISKTLAGIASKAMELSKNLGKEVQDALKSSGISDSVSGAVKKAGEAGKKAIDKISNPLKKINPFK